MTKYPYDVCAYEERYRKVYDAGAEFWEKQTPTEAVADFIHKYRPPEGLKAIDLGCGEGRDTVFLARNGFDVTSVDVSRSAVKRAKERAKKERVNINFLVADATNLPIKEKTHDLAINVACLQMMTNQNARNKHLKEIRKVLKHNGLFLSCNGGVDEPTSIEDFYKKIGIKPGDIIPRKITVEGKERGIYLPTIAAWLKSKAQYLEEFEKAGLSIVETYKEDREPVGYCWVIIVRKGKI